MQVSLYPAPHLSVIEHTPASCARCQLHAVLRLSPHQAKICRCSTPDLSDCAYQWQGRRLPHSCHSPPCQPLSRLASSAHCRQRYTPAGLYPRCPSLSRWQGAHSHLYAASASTALAAGLPWHLHLPQCVSSFRHTTPFCQDSPKQPAGQQGRQSETASPRDCSPVTPSSARRMSPSPAARPAACLSRSLYAQQHRQTHSLRHKTGICRGSPD